MVVTERDKKVIGFIEEFKVATTDTIHELFYPSLKVAQRRLRLLTENNLLKRDRDHFTAQYYYYINKSRQLRHSLLLTDFYRELNKRVKIKLFRKEFPIEDIRPDGLVIYEVEDKNYIACVEVELSNTPDIGKYERLYKGEAYKKYFNGVFPLIYYVTNKDIPTTTLKVIKISEDMSNFKI